MRFPPVTVGLMTWSAPALWSFPIPSSSDARATTSRSGRSQGRYQAAGRPDQRLVEGLVSSGVGFDDEHVVPHRPNLVRAVGVLLDHHVGDAGMNQLPNHLEPHAPGAANDDMVFQLHHLSPGLSKSNHVREIHLDHRRGDQGEPKTHRGDPAGEK
jgi:hypothetical protein